MGIPQSIEKRRNLRLLSIDWGFLCLQPFKRFYLNLNIRGEGMRVLLAIGDPNYAQIVRNVLYSQEDHYFNVIDNDVFHRRFLNEIIDIENPDILIIHDELLESDFEDGEEKENEMIQFLNDWRLNFNDKLRVVYLCERDKNDPFLGRLIAMNVLDIFHHQKIPTKLLIEQLMKPPAFANVSKINVGRFEFQESEELEEEEVIEELEEEVREEPTLPNTSVKDILNRLPKMPTLPKINRERAEEVPKKKEKPIKEPKVPATPSQKIKREINIHFGKSTTKTVGVALPRQLFVVAGATARVGTSFVAHQMAWAFASYQLGVTYLENPYRPSYTYHRLDGEVKQPGYCSVFQRISEPKKEIPRTQFIEEGIDFVIPNPLQESVYTEEDLDVDGVLRLLLTIHENPFVIVDLGNDLDSVFAKEMLAIASKVFYVIDHDIPSVIRYNQNAISPEQFIISRLKQDGRYQLIANRSTPLSQSKYMFDENVFYYPDIPS